jgi:sugar phosphate isomerase/epimerase
MKLATSTFTWGRMESERELKRMVDDVVEAGFGDVALEAGHLSHSSPDDSTSFTDYLKARGVRVIAVGGLASEVTPALVRRFRVGSTWLVFEGGSMTDWVNGTASLARAMRPEGATLGVHPHLKSPVETHAQISEFYSKFPLSSYPNVGYCLDPGHLVGANVDVPTVIEEFAERISMVHVTDFVPPPPGRPLVFEESFVDLGDGEVDYVPILKKLDEVGFKGWYVIEAHYPKNSTPLETVKKNRVRFQELESRLS